MKEFNVIENYKNVITHLKEVEEFLKAGWTIVASGQYQVADESHPTYYTHMVKETEEPVEK